MHWLKNLTSYRLTDDIDFSSLETALQDLRYKKCEPTDMSKFGWVSPLPSSEQLCFEVNGQVLLVACKETKTVPADVLKREVGERVAALEEKSQRKLKKTEKQSIQDDVLHQLLPRAFSKIKTTLLWIDKKNSLIHVGVSSSKQAEECLALLRKSLGSLPVTPVSYQISPAMVMTKWLKNGMPEWLQLGDSGKLKDFTTLSEATFKKQELDDGEVLKCINNGKSIVKLAVWWENHLSCNINEDGRVSGIKLSDVLKAGLNRSDSQAEELDAVFFLQTAEISEFLAKLGQEFGGNK